ncbi:MAG: type II toxin-antitoxin system VapC family toxin [Lentisphaeria bacterium]|nr:type II toxin-antitoxin system VapC family toxin [Lentisphaeria bacterium]
MAWVVDTCVIIDVLDADPQFGMPSAKLLDVRSVDGLVICPVSFIELAPAFQGDWQRQEYFLRQIRIQTVEGWTLADTRNAYQAWQSYVAVKPQNSLVRRRPIADIQIGAFAQRFQGLITRNPDDFAKFFPQLDLQVPGSR